MRVKKIEIFGFKSFALKQSMLFGEGVTAIVGPNGCGKSNVVDALRWVMGEQNARHLRGGSMQDIIFCGSEKKAPLGFAEVVLTIENNSQDAPLEYNHFPEIEIARRIYKTGESEYEINKQKVRLRDISDFFLGTGVGTKAYSIIEQGRINDVISMKPIDRRLIIEEAAGITKYKTKKAFAERRMEATRVNLNRIIDIKNEVDKRLSVLAREKEKLDKVEAMKTRIREIDLHKASHRYLASLAEHNFLKKTGTQFQSELEENNKEINIAEHIFSKTLEEYSKSHNQKRLLLDLETQHKTSLELQKKDLEYTKGTQANNQVLTTRITAQLSELSNQETELKKDLSIREHEHEERSSEYEAVKKVLDQKKQNGQNVVEQRQKNLFDEREVQKKIIDAATKAARLQTEITVLRDQEEQKKIDVKNLTHEESVKSEELMLLKNYQQTLTKELEQGTLQKNDLEKQLADKKLLLEQESNILVEKKQQCQGQEQELLRLSSRLKSLKEIAERCEWSDSGISLVLDSDKKHLIKGLIADVIEVKPGLEEKVEKCLAHVLDAALLSNVLDLRTVVQFLKSKNGERTAFFILNSIDQRSTFTKPLGLKCLTDLIEIPNAEFACLNAQFSRFFLADNLDEALHHWPAARMAQVFIITPEEMLMPDSSAILFGHDQGKGVLLRKNEIASLELRIKEIHVVIKKITQEIERKKKILSAYENDQNKILDDLRPLTLGVVRLEEALKQKEQEQNKQEAEQKKLLLKRLLLLKTVESVDDKIAQLSLLWSEALETHKNHEEILETIRQEKISVEADYDAFQQEIKNLEIEKASFYEKSQNLADTIARIRKNLSHIASQKNAFDEQIAEKWEEELKLNESARQIEKKLSALTKEIDETSRMLSKTLHECAVIAEQKNAQEAMLAAHKSHGQGLLQKIHDLALRINNVENEQKNLRDRVQEKYRVNLLAELFLFHQKPIDEKSATKEMEDLIRQKDRLGSVNENAGREFLEFDARSKFLDAQVSDLTEGLLQLENAIKKINKTTKMRFQEAFTSINKQFSLVFPRLFNGGKAELVLTDEEDLLNCGIDIMAKPPGKNIGTIELMSGGEKALTAISLIMAIFLIKPSPFCLLDEVDAPLDEANVARFSQLVKEMSQLSQFIVITHNRKTMESADQLYGITMEDAGQSKIVSVHVQQAFETLRQTKKPMEGLSPNTNF